MTDVEELAGVVPRATLDAWPHVAAAAPRGGVLHGGTALAVHLRHRASRDLDVFTFDEFDPDRVEASLSQRGRVAVELKTTGTLDVVLNRARVRFLWAKGQHQIEEPSVVSGMSVASLGDLYATKLNAVSSRGELRDYFDLMRIEQDTGRPIEEGISLFMARYDVDRTNPTLSHLIDALGYLDDLADDPYLADEFGPDIATAVRTYWQRRHPRLVRSFDAG